MNNIIKIKLFLISLLTLFAQATSAVTVFADFNSDMAHDTIYNTLPGSLSGSVYIELSSADFTLHGGLGGFGVHLLTNGLPISGNNDIEKAANILISPQWNFALSKTITTPDSADVIGNTFNFPSFTTSPLHLFDFTIDAPVGKASYIVQLSDVAGDSFVADDFFAYDSTIIFEQSQINVVPIPAAMWLFLAGLIPFYKFSRQNIKIAI